MESETPVGVCEVAPLLSPPPRVHQRSYAAWFSAVTVCVITFVLVSTHINYAGSKVPGLFLVSKGKLETLKREVATLATRTDDAHERRVNAKASLIDAESRLEEAESEVGNQDRRIQLLKKDLSAARQRSDKLEERLDEQTRQHIATVVKRESLEELETNVRAARVRLEEEETKLENMHRASIVLKRNTAQKTAQTEALFERVAVLEDVIQTASESVKEFEERDGESSWKDELTDEKILFVEGQLREAKVRHEAAKRSAHVLERDNQETKAAIAKLQKEQEHTEKQISMLNDVADEASSRRLMQTPEKKLATLKSKLNEAEEGARDAEAELDNVNRMVQKLEENLRKRATELENLEDELDAEEERLDAGMNEVEENSRKVLVRRGAISERNMKRLEEELQELKAKLVKCSEEYADKSTIFTEMEEELEDVEGRYDVLDEHLKELEAEAAQVGNNLRSFETSEEISQDQASIKGTKFEEFSDKFAQEDEAAFTVEQQVEDLEEKSNVLQAKLAQQQLENDKVKKEFNQLLDARV